MDPPMGRRMDTKEGSPKPEHRRDSQIQPRKNDLRGNPNPILAAHDVILRMG